jgi:NAD(P)-dependent dehydrogenase (short-subunit alcohol dehydrogenase family)
MADILDAKPGAAAIEKEGGQALALHTDVTDPASAREMVSQTVARFGKLDVLINNAAIFGSLSLKPFDQISSEEWAR